MEERQLLFFSEGDRVLVRGTTDGKRFFDEPGTITDHCYESFTPDSYVEITFDSWNHGWGDGERKWACEACTVFLVSEENDFSQQDLCISIDQLFEE